MVNGKSEERRKKKRSNQWKVKKTLKLLMDVMVCGSVQKDTEGKY